MSASTHADIFADYEPSQVIVLEYFLMTKNMILAQLLADIFADILEWLQVGKCQAQSVYQAISGHPACSSLDGLINLDLENFLNNLVEIPTADHLRLHMGELTPEEVLVARSAYSLAKAELRVQQPKTEVLSAAEILQHFANEGMDCNPNQMANRLYTVRGQRAQLINGAMSLVAAARAQACFGLEHGRLRIDVPMPDREELAALRRFAECSENAVSEALLGRLEELGALRKIGEQHGSHETTLFGKALLSAKPRGL